MAQAVIGALRVNLGLNSAAFSKGIKKSTGELGSFGRVAANAMRAAAVGAAAVTGAMAHAVLGVSKYADEMGKSAQSVGLPVEKLSELRHAADMSGASFGDLQTGIRKLSQTMGDALTTPASEGARALNSLGISVRDASGNLKTGDQVLGDVAESFSNIEDGVLKTDAAMAIFGRSGTALIPMLNEGRAGLAAFGDEARNLGLVISEDTFQQSQAFNDNLARMRKVFEGIKISLASGVLPAFKLLSDRFVEGLINSEALKSATAALSGVFIGMAKVITVVFNNLDTLFSLFKIFVAAKIVTYFTAIVGTFLTLARAIRTTGLVMVAFNAVSKLSVAKIALIGGALALATGNFDALEAKISGFASKVSSMLPESLTNTGRSFMEGLSIDTAGAAESMSTYIGVQNEANRSLANTAGLASRLSSAEGLGAVGVKAAQGAVMAKDAWDGLRVAAKETTQEMSNSMESTFQGIGSGIADAIKGVKSWKDVAIDALQAIASNMLQSAFSSGGFGGGIFGSLAKGLFGGLKGFASGGDHIGGLRIVGENGPELEATGPSRIFNASQTKSMLSNSISAGNQAVHVTVGLVNDGLNIAPEVRSISQSEASSAVSNYSRGSLARHAKNNAELTRRTG